MNERIKEFAEQAKDWKRGNGGMDYLAVDLEKFAELIVRECAKLVEDNMDPQNAWISPGFIKEHFGIE